MIVFDLSDPTQPVEINVISNLASTGCFNDQTFSLKDIKYVDDKLFILDYVFGIA